MKDVSVLIKDFKMCQCVVEYHIKCKTISSPNPTKPDRNAIDSMFAFEFIFLLLNVYLSCEHSNEMLTGMLKLYGVQGRDTVS